MKYSIFSVFALLMALFVSCSNSSEPIDDKQLPNIVIIYLDDIAVFGDC